MALSKQRRERVKQRATIALVVGAVTVTGTTIVVWADPLREFLLCGVLITVGGVIGTSRDQRVIDAATVTPFAPPRLTKPSVTRALRSLGVSGMTGKDAELTYPARRSLETVPGGERTSISRMG